MVKLLAAELYVNCESRIVNKTRHSTLCRCELLWAFNSILTLYARQTGQTEQTGQTGKTGQTGQTGQTVAEGEDK
jgi:hypothetical protein